MKDDDFEVPSHIDLFQAHQELRSEKTAYISMVNIYEKSIPGAAEGCYFHISRNEIKVKLNNAIKYIYYWIEMMNNILSMSKEKFIQKYITSKVYLYPDNKNVLEALVSENENIIQKIPNPGKKESRALESKRSIFKQYDRLFRIFGVLFILEFIYSLYVISLFFPSITLPFILVGVFVFIYSILVILEPSDATYRQFIIISDVLLALAVSFIIYHTSLRSGLGDISILLFIIQVVLSSFLYHLKRKIKLKDKEIAKRLPNTFKKIGINGTEKIVPVPKIPDSKERFVKLLTSYNTKINDLCPNCNGSGYLKEFKRCSHCNGSGQTTEYNYRTINDDYKTSYKVACYYCGGSGGEYVTVTCNYCSNGHINSKVYEEELKEFLLALIKQINSFSDSVYLQINEINSEIDKINRKISIWNSKTL